MSFRGGQGGSRTAPTGGRESRLGGGCAFRRDGFLPPQERRWGVTVWGGPRSTLRSASADLQQAQGERPLTKDGFRLSGAGMTGGGGGSTGGCGWGASDYGKAVNLTESSAKEILFDGKDF